MSKRTSGLFLVLAAMFAPALAMAAAPVAAAAATIAASASLEAPPAAETFTVGTLRVQRYGQHGRPLILIPGLDGGSWVWRSTIEHFRGSHVIYAVTLAGFDGLPPPKDPHDLMGQANASLLQLIQTRHLDQPVLIGHSLGGTLAIRFAELHSSLLGGVVAVDGLPVFPGAERATPAQRKAFAERMTAEAANATPEQREANALRYMQTIGTIDPATAKLYAPLNARSNPVASAEYLQEDVEADYRPDLKDIHVPLLEISPYNAPDFSHPPMVMTESQKADYYRSLLAGAPDAKVISISPSRHFVMLDQPQKFLEALSAFLAGLPASK